ncbi:protein FAR1-related sequence 5-like, partial [Trifolium pratense]
LVNNSRMKKCYAKSDNGGNGRTGYVTLGCQRGGEYMEYIHKEREEKTTKCDCPFKVKSYLLRSGRWSLNVVNGEHDHEMNEHFQGHKYVERLRPEEKELVRELTKNMTLMRNIMSTLKKTWQLMATTIKHIYNARYRLKQSSRGPKTEMLHLLK